MYSASTYNRKPVSGTPREIEAWALMEAARRIDAARRAPEKPDALRQALMLNQRLWTILQAEVSTSNGVMPDDLRKNILTLSLTVDRQTLNRLADLDPGKMDLLININRSLAAGLSVTPDQPAGVARPDRPMALAQIA